MNNTLVYISIFIILFYYIFSSDNKTTESFKNYFKRKGVVKQPLYHPAIFQQINHGDRYHDIFDATKVINTANTGNLPAQAI